MILGLVYVLERFFGYIEIIFSVNKVLFALLIVIPAILFSVLFINISEYTLSTAIALFIYIIIWLSGLIIAFSLTQKIDPISLRVFSVLAIPISFTLDNFLGYSKIGLIQLIGISILFLSMYTSIGQCKSLKIKGKLRIKLLTVMFIGIIIRVTGKTLLYHLRAEVGITTYEILFFRSVYGLGLILIYMKLRGKLDLKSIKKNKRSHFIAGLHSGFQQIINTMVSGYIPASISNVISSIFTYVAIPITKRSKESNTSDIDSRAIIPTTLNLIGVIFMII